MDDFGFEHAWPFLIPIVAIVGAFATAIIATISRARVRELEIRERIAMIEKGLVPPPEVDPGGFDRAMGERERDRYAQHVRYRPVGRHRRVGIILMGIGFGLMVLINFGGGDVGHGIGVGGFLVIIGLAFLINSLFESRDSGYLPPPAGSPPPSRTTTSSADPH